MRSSKTITCGDARNTFTEIESSNTEPTEQDLINLWAAEPLPTKTSHLPKDFEKLLKNPLLQTPKKDHAFFYGLSKLFSDLCTLVTNKGKLQSNHEQDLRYFRKRSRRMTCSFLQLQTKKKGVKRLGCNMMKLGN